MEWARRDRGRSPRPRRPQAPRCPDRDRDRPRRCDDQRHLHPHGHDRQGVLDALRRVVRGDGRRRHRSGRRHQDRGRVAADARRSTRRSSTTVRGLDAVALATGSGARRAQHEDPHARGEGGQHAGCADSSGSASTRPRCSPVQPAQPPRGPLARGAPTRSSSMPGRRTSRGTRSATRSRSRPSSRSAPFKLVGVAQYGEPRLPRERHLRHLHDPGRAGAPRPGGPVRRDLGRRHRGTTPGRARRGDRSRSSRTTRRS